MKMIEKRNMLGLFLFSYFLSVSGQQNLNQQSGQGQTDSKSGLSSGKPTLFNITSTTGDFLALLQFTGVEIQVADVDKTGKIDLSKKNIDVLDGKMTATGTRNKDNINIVLTYRNQGSKGSGDLTVKDATLTMDISTSVEIFTDYWRMSSAELDLTYSMSGAADTKLSVDVTPRFGYTDRPEDLQCGTGYSICAPNKLSWSCGSNQLREVNSTESKGKQTALLTFKNLYLQPFEAQAKHIKFGFNWDCDPLIPISIWSGIIVSLGLAAIVWWSLSMVGNVYTPSKFDDPKGPALMISQTD